MIAMDVKTTVPVSLRNQVVEARSYNSQWWSLRGVKISPRTLIATEFLTALPMIAILGSWLCSVFH
jgi:hypothetical protein